MTSAIPFALLCNLLYAVGYALANLLSGSLDPLEITFLRSVLVLLAAGRLALGTDALLFGRLPPWEALAGAGLIAGGGLLLRGR